MLWFFHLLNAAAYASMATSVALSPRQIEWPTLPNNLTEDVLRVAGAISPPCAANSSWCQQLTTVVIPRCERLRGDPGCWCGNHDPVHYCAICMSSPSDNQTTPDQMQAATAGHNESQRSMSLAMHTLQKPDLLGSAQERGERHGALPNLVEPPELHSAISQLTSDPKRESIRYNLTQKR
ncbi:hypothetical protein BN14_09433 [Rhizoctonia solani AG-1 IB]|uniref:Uncharacterized protein n=1 Tax=Thanatephorus cucumeris (strain AG1-IB / isolate 7/3/14) TaxID=1108050 RepID=M5C7B0_THACB|nr:hypothetical protein BN14_09433 [Rhizoctonia solani AG-1 IB]